MPLLEHIIIRVPRDLPEVRAFRARRGCRGLQAFRVQPDGKVRRVLKGIPVLKATLVYEDLQGCRETPGLKVRLGPKVKLALRAGQAFKVLRESKASREIQESRVYRA